ASCRTPSSSASRSNGVDRRRVEHSLEVGGSDAHQKSAPAAVDVDRRQREDRTLNENRQWLARTEGRRPADLVAGVALRHFRRARLDALAAGLPRELLG